MADKPTPCTEDECNKNMMIAAEMCCLGRYDEVGWPLYQTGINEDAHLLWCERCGRLGIIDAVDGDLRVYMHGISTAEDRAIDDAEFDQTKRTGEK